MAISASLAVPREPAPVTVFERMSRLARHLGAINLGQGFPDMAEPAEVIAAAQRALVERPNQYPPMRGLPELRNAIAAYYERTQRISVDPDSVVVTSGATEALAAAFLALVRPGDEVVLVQPLYDSYIPLVRRAGGTPVLIDLVPPHWMLPLDRLEAAITPATRLIVLNTPNNPTGTALDRATLEAVGALCERHDIVLLCDEVWEAMLFDRAHVSPLGIASLRDRTVKVGSAGKIFSLTGWKVGWAIAAPPLADAIAAQHQYLTFTTAPPLQWAIAEGLALPPEWHTEHRARYARARRRLGDGLAAQGYHLLPASGTWFVTIDLAASGLARDDVGVAEAMIREAGVASIPVSAFYAARAETGYLRLCFAKQDDVLDAAIERLGAFRRGADMTAFASAAQAIVDVGRRLDARGWAPATAGNYSLRLDDGSIAVTVSGSHKGRLTPADMMLVTPDGVPRDGKRPSAETLLHCLIYAIDPTANAVLHTHSITGTVLSRAVADAQHISLTGYELLKIFPGIDTHDTSVAIPIVDNDQDMPALGDRLRPLLTRFAPPLPAFYIRGHGLYGWGATIAAAEHCIEATEFLLACAWEEHKLKGSTA